MYRFCGRIKEKTLEPVSGRGAPVPAQEGVQMLTKKSIIKSMREGIKAADLRGYKWTVKTDDKLVILSWSYGVDFELTMKPKIDGCEYKLEDPRSGVNCCVFTDLAYWLTDNTYFFPIYDDQHAVTVLTQRLIALANHLY